MDLSALRTLIDSDPANDPPATDATVLAWCLAPVPTVQDVDHGVLLKWLAAWDLGDVFETEAAAVVVTRTDPPSTDQKKRSYCKEAMRLVNAGWGMRLSDPEVLAMLAGLRDLGVISTAEHDDLIARAQLPKPRAAALGTPSLGDVLAARAL